MRKIVRDPTYQVNQKAFLGLLGYKKGKSSLSQFFYLKMQGIIQKARQVIEPIGVYSFYRISEISGDYLILEGGIRLDGNSISKHCKGFSHVYLMAVTIGGKTDELIEKSPVEEAMIIDAFGSEAVEGVAETLNRFIEREGVHFNFFRFNQRFSPGYGDLPLETNALFEGALKMEEIGLQIMPNYSLSPRKSITAIIPAGG